MAITVTGTQITFNDLTVQTTAFTGGSYAGPNFQAFGTSGTFTVPSGITRLEVYVWAGGGGGRGVNTVGQVGGDGGICGFGAASITGLTPGGSISVTVGAGGAGGNGANGSTGGTSSFGTYISCTGGVGGTLSSTRSLPGAATFSGVAQTLAKNNYVLNQPSTSAYTIVAPAPSVSMGGGENGTTGLYDGCASTYPGGGGGGGYGGGGGGGSNGTQNATGLGGPAYGGGVNGASATAVRTGGNGGGNGIASNGGAGAAGSTFGGGGGGGGGFVLVTW